MQAERVITRTNVDGQLIELPKLPANRQIEAIFIVLEESVENLKAMPAKRRIPPACLRNTVIVNGDLTEPLMSDEEWEASLERTARQIEGDPEAFK